MVEEMCVLSADDEILKKTLEDMKYILCKPNYSNIELIMFMHISFTDDRVPEDGSIHCADLGQAEGREAQEGRPADKEDVTNGRWRPRPQ